MMNVFVRNMVLILFMWLLSAGVCFGRQVFLKGGGSIDSQLAWQKGGKVFVKVNRDIIADFNANEIDLRRTFPKSPASRHVQHKVTADRAVKTADNVPLATAPAALPASAAAPVAEKPLPQAAPSTAPATPAPAPDRTEMMKKVLETQSKPVPQVMTGFSISILLIFLMVCLLVIASQWLVFQMAGQAGWKSLVPFYNMYILMEISGKPGWWMFLLLIPLVGVAVLLFALLSLAKRFGRSELFGAGLLLLPMIFFPLLAFGDSEYKG